MNMFFLDKCSLFREIKKYKIAGKRNAASQFQRFQLRLDAIIPDKNFKILPFEDVVYVKFRMLHDSTNAIGYSKKPEKILTLSFDGFRRSLMFMRQMNEAEPILIYSNYQDEMPFVITTFGNFIDHFPVFFELLEDDLSILSEKLDSYLSINSEDITYADEITIKSIGTKFGSLFQAGLE